MRNRNTNIFLRGTAIFLLIIATVLTISSLIGYSRQRNNYPPGMTMGGVPIGGLDPQAASQRVLQVYKTPIQIQYNGDIIQIDPTSVGFQLDIDSMLAAADLSRTGGAFWGGFWDYLWNRDPTPEAVPLRATISEDRLRAYLQTEIAPRYDQPPSVAQPIPGSPNFTQGKPGLALDIDRAVPLLEDALRSSSNRSVSLTSTQNAAATRPTVQNLEILMKQIVATSGFDGITGVYMLDLQNGQEIHFALNNGQELSVDPDVVFSGASTIKIPILVAYFIQHGKGPVDDSVNKDMLLMIVHSDDDASDRIMYELDPTNGPLVVTQDMEKIGLQNTFLAGYFRPGSPQLQIYKTPANQRQDILTAPDRENQTTPSDMGMLLGDIYQCSETGGGTLVAVFPEKIDRAVCKQIISYLVADKIGTLIEAGVPEGTVVAMKHGWESDTFLGGPLYDVSAAGIVYTAGGNFVLSAYTYHPIQNVWGVTNLLIANLTRSVYNYFNLASQKFISLSHEEVR